MRLAICVDYEQRGSQTDKIMKTKRVFEVIKDPQLFRKERSNESIRKDCRDIDTIVERMERSSQVFEPETAAQIFEHLSEIKERLLVICDELDKQQDDED